MKFFVRVTLLVVAVSSAAQTVPSQPSVVTISGRQLLVQRRNPDGSLGPVVPYVIRGVNWSPADPSTGSSSPAVRRVEFGQWYATDIPLLKAMNVNTVRFFIDPGIAGDSGITVPGSAILDELYRNDIMAIMTVDDGNNTTSRIATVVNTYKNHPAILMWSIGSEWNINRFFGKFSTVDAAAAAVEAAAQEVKANDAGHPVASSYGTILQKPDSIEKYVNETCPTIDIWSFNEYRGPGFSRFFDKWGFISAKPMFLGEYGIDAYNSTTSQEDQATHALWGGWLWDDIARNLSADESSRTALGGAIFEWNDEWWKAGGLTTQDTGGWSPPAFPDMFASEDWWGVVDIQRQPRQLYQTLTTRFAPGYQPPPQPKAATYRVVSVNSWNVQFWEDAALMYQGLGASIDGGRGFNIAAIDPQTGRLLYPIQRFDTWASRTSGTAHNAMIAFINGVPAGTILLIAVADEAGLNNFDSCTFLTFSWVTAVRQLLQSLGGTQINGYCYRDQWAMLAIKGQGALGESLSTSGDASVQLRVHAPWTDDPLAAQVTIVKAMHVAELRSRLDLIRAAKGLSAYSWTDPSLTPGSSSIRGTHLAELRAAVNDTYAALSMTPPAYTDPVVAPGLAVRAVHFAELRAAILTIE